MDTFVEVKGKDHKKPKKGKKVVNQEEDFTAFDMNDKIENKKDKKDKKKKKKKLNQQDDDML